MSALGIYRWIYEYYSTQLKWYRARRAPNERVLYFTRPFCNVLTLNLNNIHEYLSFWTSIACIWYPSQLLQQTYWRHIKWAFGFNNTNRKRMNREISTSNIWIIIIRRRKKSAHIRCRHETSVFNNWIMLKYDGPIWFFLRVYLDAILYGASKHDSDQNSFQKMNFNFFFQTKLVKKW